MFGRRHPIPPSLGIEIQAGAAYILDAGVGLAFAHVGRLELLAEHYGGQLIHVDDVALEWRRRANRAIPALEPGHSVQDRGRRDRDLHVKAAAKVLEERAEELFGPALETTDDDQIEIDDLVSELCKLNPEIANTGGNRGECASVLVGSRMRGQGQMVVLCTNDDRARRLGASRGLAHRNMHTVLREMVAERRLGASDAYDLYLRMAEVTELPEYCRPASVADFE